MEYLWKTKRLIMELGPLTLIILVALGTGLLFGLLNLVESKALVGFLGVIIGGFISSVTSLLVVKENYRSQLRIAVLDKRLNAHQVAYALWDEIKRAVHDKDKNKINDLHRKAYEFWKDNCLYLDGPSRKAFKPCMTAAINLNQQLQIDLQIQPNKHEIIRLIEENWEKVRKLGKTLEEGVLLPTLGDDEFPAEMKNA